MAGVVACLITGASAEAYASERACLVLPAATDAETCEAYLAALRIESRKAGLSFEWGLTPSPSECPTPHPLVALITPESATLRLPSGAMRTLDMSAMTSSARARSLARVAVRELADASPEAAGGALPILGEDDDIKLGGVTATSESTEPTAPQPDPRLLLRVGGAYLHQFEADLHFGGLTFEAGVSLYAGRLAVSLVGAWFPGSENEPLGIPVSVECGELLAMVRGGLRFDPVTLRAGLGAGWQRRNVDLAATDRTRAEATSSDAAIVALDLEMVWHFVEDWHLGVVVNGRVYAGGPDHLFMDRPVYEAAPASLGGQLVLGFTP